MLNLQPGEPGNLGSRFPSSRLVAFSGLKSQIYPDFYVRVYLLLDELPIKAVTLIWPTIYP